MSEREGIGDRVNHLFERIRQIREPMVRRRKEVVDRFLRNMEERGSRGRGRSRRQDEEKEVEQAEENQRLKRRVKDLEEELRSRVYVE